MLAIRRRAVQSAEQLPKSLGRSSRRYASDHGHGDHGHAGPKSESLGTQFYVVLAVVPLSIGLYSISRPKGDGSLSGLTKLIDSYSYYKERFAARNTLHTAMIEQAAFDRNLYQSAVGTKHVNLRMPELFNSGSPYNVSAGQGARNMDQLLAHYEKENAENEEKKLDRLEARAQAARNAA